MLEAKSSPLGLGSGNQL